MKIIFKARTVRVFFIQFLQCLCNFKCLEKGGERYRSSGAQLMSRYTYRTCGLNQRYICL